MRRKSSVASSGIFEMKPQRQEQIFSIRLMKTKLTEPDCWYMRQMDPTLDAFWVGTHTSSPNSCYLTAACHRWGRFFLVGLGPGAAVGGMLPETNTGHSCYLTAARRRWFFSLVNLGPDSGLWAPEAAVCSTRIEINTGYSCYFICNNSRQKTWTSCNVQVLLKTGNQRTVPGQFLKE